ncbi:MAG: hypothetical protein Tsb0017_00100 [Geothermobacteraceae bacterium]
MRTWLPRFIAGLVMALLTAGCGYHVAGYGSTLLGGVKRVYIETFRNRTAEPFLDTLVSNAVERRFQRSRTLQVVDSREQAEAVLTGEVSFYQSKPVSYDKNDKVSEYRTRMKLSARLEVADSGRRLWQGELSRREEYAASDNLALQEDRERAAAEVLAEDLADDLYERLLDDF